ncbi:MAG: DUF3108 domain-containing protein [Alphaproteobacteria bacterium]
MVLRSVRFFGVALVLAGALTTPVTAHAATTHLKATYLISIAGLTIGRAQVEGRFAAGQYATAISGATFGISRFVSDATAVLAGNGHIDGTMVLPVSYNLQTREDGFGTLVRMAMSDGAVTEVEAMPNLIEATDRVPVRKSDKRDVVDPIGAFVVSLGSDGAASDEAVCDRTVRVFDGWQRFDVRLFYKHTKTVRSGYSGPAIVCGARYVPVAGHRPGREAVQYMAANKRLEVWLVPVEGTNVMVPYQFVIGTKIGDLLITARRFKVTLSEKQAAAR